MIKLLMATLTAILATAATTAILCGITPCPVRNKKPLRDREAWIIGVIILHEDRVTRVDRWADELDQFAANFEGTYIEDQLKNQAYVQRMSVCSSLTSLERWRPRLQKYYEQNGWTNE